LICCPDVAQITVRLRDESRAFQTEDTRGVAFTVNNIAALLPGLEIPDSKITLLEFVAGNNAFTPNSLIKPGALTGNDLDLAIGNGASGGGSYDAGECSPPAFQQTLHTCLLHNVVCVVFDR
jgi:hypothetical protein